MNVLCRNKVHAVLFSLLLFFFFAIPSITLANSHEDAEYFLVLNVESHEIYRDLWEKAEAKKKSEAMLLLADSGNAILIRSGKYSPNSPEEGASVTDSEAPIFLAESKTPIKIRPDDNFDDYDEEGDLIADPLEPINRVFFHINDKLYFWFLKPVATGYATIFPERFRVSVRHFFSNLGTPVRAVNCLLQGKIDGFGNELLRFVVNTSAGCFGLVDIAKIALNVDKQDEDFGQTLGFFGFGPAIYIYWPILGPSSLRDTIGFAADSFLDPVNYVIAKPKYRVAVKGYEKGINRTSLSIGEYEDLKKASLDPYVSMRDAYYQYRKNKIKK